MPETLGIILGLGIGIGLGYLIAYLHLRLKASSNDGGDRVHELERLQAVQDERLQQQDETIRKQTADLEKQNSQEQELREALHQRERELASLQTRVEEELKHNEEKQTFFKESLEKLDKQFKATASELLVNTGEKITKQQSGKLEDMMKPFKENLSRFEKEFKSAYEKEAREQISLKEHIKQLSVLNKELSTEAQALANALKGDSKVRGNWGEQMLEHILQSSGLREGHEYETQSSYDSEEGRLQPDVIVNLPDDKCIIIDSKVTLNSWMDFVNADSEEFRAAQLKSFTQAIHQHVKSLSDKAYHKIYDIQTLDFVLMFIPIETAFLYALQADGSIYEEAHKRNIILVSPTTLMAVLKTIAVNWKHDRQDKNTLLIAREAEKLLDKIYNYMDTLMKARKSLDAANNHMDLAVRRFAGGKGNIKDSTDKLRQLGVKSAKKLGVEWEQIEEDEDDLDLLEDTEDRDD